MSSSIDQFFPTRITEFELLTCDRSRDLVDFGAFLKPFDLEVWLSLVILVWFHVIWSRTFGLGRRGVTTHRAWGITT